MPASWIQLTWFVVLASVGDRLVMGIGSESPNEQTAQEKREEGDTGEVYDMREGLKILKTDAASPAGLRASERAGQGWLRANAKHSIAQEGEEEQDNDSDYSDDRLDMSEGKGLSTVSEADDEESESGDEVDDSDEKGTGTTNFLTKKSSRSSTRGLGAKAKLTPFDIEQDQENGGEQGEAYDTTGGGFKIVDKAATSPAGLRASYEAGQAWLRANTRHSANDDEVSDAADDAKDDGESDYSDDRLDITQQN